LPAFTIRKGVSMELSDKTFCEEILLDVICYEICRGHLSPEMEFIFEEHLERCPNCRHKILAFLRILREEKFVRNFG
jgi:hypothetical protein